MAAVWRLNAYPISPVQGFEGLSALNRVVDNAIVEVLKDTQYTIKAAIDGGSACSFIAASAVNGLFTKGFKGADTIMHFRLCRCSALKILNRL